MEAGRKESHTVNCALRAEFLVNAGREQDFEAQLADAQRRVRAMPGFQGELVLNALGHPGKYVTITHWKDHDTLTAFAHSPDRLAATAGDGVYAVGRPEEAYEVAFTVGRLSNAAGAWSQLVEWNIKSGAAGAFEASRKELFDLRQHHGGIVFSQLFRFLGNSAQYLVMQAYESRDAEKAGRGTPDINQFFARNPPTEYVTRPPSNEYYTVVLVA